MPIKLTYKPNTMKKIVLFSMMLAAMPNVFAQHLERVAPEQGGVLGGCAFRRKRDVEWLLNR